MYKIMRVPEKGLVATSQSLAASFNGSPYKVDFSHGFSLCAQITDGGSINGSFKLQASNNAFDANVNNDTRSDAIWVDIPSTATAVTGTTAIFWNVGDCYYEAVRVVYTRTGGTGTALIYFLAKGDG